MYNSLFNKKLSNIEFKIKISNEEWIKYGLVEKSKFFQWNIFDLYKANGYMTKIDNGKYTINHTILKRIFSRGSFSLGGRFYGLVINNLSPKLRKSILINGEPVAEPDFACLHTTMAYHKSGLEPPENPYKIEKSETLDNQEKALYRRAFKMALNILINAKTVGKAKAAFNNEKIKNEELRKIDTNTIFNEVMEYHKPIAHFFGSDFGIHAQLIDSQIMENIMYKLLLKMNIPMFPIHDSVLCKKSDEQLVIDTMKSEYKAVMGYDIKVG